MPVIFKLVGKDESCKLYQIKHNDFVGCFNLNDLHNKFVCFDLSKQDIINNIVFFVQNNSNNVKIEESDIINITEQDTKIVYLFIKNINVRNMLVLFFKMTGEEIKNISVPVNPVNPVIINKPLQESKTESLVDENDIIEVNKKSLEVLSDPDFISALNIFHKKPHIYNSLAQYVQNSVIHPGLQSNKTINDLTPEELDNYKQLANSIKDLDFSEELIINALILYNGRLNLAVRSLIVNNLLA